LGAGAVVSDQIVVRGIRAWGRHGANPGERDVPQPLHVDLTLWVDVRDAERSDDLADTIDYARTHAEIVQLVETSSCALLEHLAGRMLQTIFRDARVSAAEVTIAKPGILEGATPAVTLKRCNPAAW